MAGCCCSADSGRGGGVCVHVRVCCDEWLAVVAVLIVGGGGGTGESML